jgi:hypothetical protein
VLEVASRGNLYFNNVLKHHVKKTRQPRIKKCDNCRGFKLREKKVAMAQALDPDWCELLRRSAPVLASTISSRRLLVTARS